MPHRPFTTMLIGTLVLSCGDQRTPAEPSAGPSPSASGAILIRGPFQPGVLSGHVRYAIAVGYEEPFAAHCGDFESPDQAGSTQIVISPSGRVHIRGAGKRVNVRVYEFPGAVTATCDLVNAPLVATGTVDFNLTVVDGTPGAVHVGAKFRGVVDLAGGGQARLQATGFTLFRPDGSFAFDHVRIGLRSL